MTLKPPPSWLLPLEGRAPWELGASLACWPMLRLAAPGDGHAVLVLPGLATSDASMLPLRAFLAQCGYSPSGWGQRINRGPREGVIERTLERMRALRRSSGRKVSLVGWSLGGLYARELAKLSPDDVRCVVTLGAPFTGHPKATRLWRLYEALSGYRAVRDEWFTSLASPPPVPTTSIFSRSDALVAWRCCLQPPSARAESVEVTSSHLGIGLHPAAWYAVADRLSQRPRTWEPFHRDGWRRWLYGDPYRAASAG